MALSFKQSNLRAARHFGTNPVSFKVLSEIYELKIQRQKDRIQLNQPIGCSAHLIQSIDEGAHIQTRFQFKIFAMVMD